MKRRVMRRKAARSLTWTDARTRATALTSAPIGEASSAVTSGGIRSRADARSMATLARLAGGHLQRDEGRVLVAGGGLARHRAEPLLPAPHRIAPGRKPLQGELPG